MLQWYISLNHKAIEGIMGNPLENTLLLLDGYCISPVRIRILCNYFKDRKAFHLPFLFFHLYYENILFLIDYKKSGIGICMACECSHSYYKMKTHFKLHEYCQALTILSYLRPNRFFEGALISDLQMKSIFLMIQSTGRSFK